VSAATSSDDDSDDGDSAESPALSDSELVSAHENSSSSQSLPSPSSENNSSNSEAAVCSCTNTIFHLISCPVPFSRRVSLHFTSPSSVLPRAQCSYNVDSVLSQRLTSLIDASDAQKQLINVGSSVSRASCSLKPDVWSSLLVDYVPSDRCYTAEVLVAGMQHGSLVRYEGDRTEYEH
jgi:hypothetical protein